MVKNSKPYLTLQITVLVVLRVLAYKTIKKKTFDHRNETRLIKESGLENIQALNMVSTAAKGDLLSIGIIGFGNREV